jgi:hypothetical protein
MGGEARTRFWRGLMPQDSEVVPPRSRRHPQRYAVPQETRARVVWDNVALPCNLRYRLFTTVRLSDTFRLSANNEFG